MATVSARMTTVSARMTTRHVPVTTELTVSGVFHHKWARHMSVATRHVPVAKHPPSSYDWKAEEEDLFGLRRMAHAVERVGQIFDGGLHLLLGDPLGQEIDRHL